MSYREWGGTAGHRAHGSGRVDGSWAEDGWSRPGVDGAGPGGAPGWGGDPAGQHADAPGWPGDGAGRHADGAEPPWGGPGYPHARWPGTDEPGHGWPPGADEDGWTVRPETGSWSSRYGRWIPQQRGPEGPDFAISRFEDTGDIEGVPEPPGHGQVLDHGDWYEVPAAHGGRDEWAGDWAGASSYRDEPATGWSDRPHGWDSPAAPNGWDRGAAGALPVRSGRSAGYPGGELQRAGHHEPMDAVEEEYGYPGAVLATVAWYAVPILLYVAWSLLLDGVANPGCFDAVGAPCLSPRAQALHDLLAALPRIGVAVALSVLAAGIIRWFTGTWRGLTVGFAAAVVGAGTATVLFSLLTRLSA